MRKLMGLLLAGAAVVMAFDDEAKQSGNGHDKSLHALDRYVDLKTAWISLA